MTFDDFIKRVQEQAGVTSAQQARQAVEATLATLRACLADGGPDSLPAEVRQQLGSGLLGGLPGQPRAAASANPQMDGQERVESGGESTAETGQ
jgi:uncharacterized protein (DUF2267 family)